VSVGGIILDGDRVLLIKRAHEPSKGAWSIPGGVVELGETLAEALAREVLEETGLSVRVGPIAEVVDRVQRADDGSVDYHFVIIDYLCYVEGGTVACGTDAADARWIPKSELEQMSLPPGLREVLHNAFS
jgi:ADP-ribose pyrophosphatase YjhB (NUDIX family)